MSFIDAMIRSLESPIEDEFLSILNQARPFIAFVALLFGLLAAWLALLELFPVLAQVWRPRGTAQGHAIVGACLSLIGGRA